MALELVMTSCLVLLALCCLHGDARHRHITDLDVSVSSDGDHRLRARGFVKIPVDLNKGAGGRYIYLWFKKGDSPAITSLSLTFTRNNIIPGYTKIYHDLNKGAGGDYIYLWYQRGSGTPIVDISVTTNSDQEAYRRATGWERVPGDLNRGAGGAYIYIWMKRAY